jgi:hypothetical protein
MHFFNDTLLIVTLLRRHPIPLRPRPSLRDPSKHSYAQKSRDTLNGTLDVAGESNRTVQAATLRANSVRVSDDHIYQLGHDFLKTRGKR